MDETKYILAKEAAELEVKKIFDYYEIDLEEIEDKEHKKFIQMNYDRLIKAVRLGRLEVKLEKGIQIIQHLRDSQEAVIYVEINGEAKSATAGKDKEDFYGRIYAVQGSLTGVGEAGIKKMKGVDLSLCEVLGAIFLSA
jgi:hypothetical protein